MFMAYTVKEIEKKMEEILAKVFRQGEWFPDDTEKYLLLQEELMFR